MIILLDSNFRNREIYTDPSNYVIQVNGTPSERNISDARSFNFTNNNIAFSFYFFSELTNIPYVCFDKNILNINIINVDILKYFNKIVDNILVNFLVGYVVQDQINNKSSIIISNYITNNILYITIENSIIGDNQNSILKIINPSLSCGNNLLINGYSTFNFTPNLGYFQNDGINNSSLIINLTKNIQTNIISLESPFRNVIFEPISSNLTPFTISHGDYIVVLNNKLININITNFSYLILDIFPTSVQKFEIINQNFNIQDITKGERFISYFGDDVSTTFEIYQNEYFRITPIQPTRKIILVVEEIIDNVFQFRIEQPGNGIIRFEKYELYSETNPSQILEIRPIVVNYSFLCKNLILKKMDNYLGYLLTMYTAVPYYTKIIDAKYNLLYTEIPFFIEEDFIYIYNRIGFIPYYSFYPNLPILLNYTIGNNTLLCFRVRMVNLSLPNLLICGTNYLLSDFPYVFVTFGNCTNSGDDLRSGTNNLNSLWSNDPIAQTATFVCAIANIKTPNIIKYVVVKSSQVVTIKLNIAQNFRFSVFLPNGDLVRFANNYKINYNKYYVSSNICNNNQSLTFDTKVFPFENEITISATFFLTPN
jgi:hypothetical protein